MRRPAGERVLSVQRACGARQVYAKCSFDGEARPGDVIQYRAVIEQANDIGASVTVKGDIAGRPFCDAEIFFARFDADSTPHTKGRVLFNPADLLGWLRAVGVFEVGVRPDGTRLCVEDYSALPAGVRMTPLNN